MSVYDLLLNENKPWLNISVNSMVVQPTTLSSQSTLQSLSIDNSGQDIYIPVEATIAAIYQVSLPQLLGASGFSSRIILTASINSTSSTLQFIAPSACIDGQIWSMTATAYNATTPILTTTNFSNKTNIFLNGSTPNGAIAGDYLDIESNGINYFVRATSSGGTNVGWSVS